MEIPFRAKSIDGGQLVEGYYVKCRNHHYILPVHDEQSGFDERWIQLGADDEIGWFEIAPATLSMYTGVDDKSGKKIFGAIGEKGGDVWQEELTAAIFIATFTENHIFELVPVYLPKTYHFIKPIMCASGTGEVIGTVVDNPELLK